ncbi:hypothetical protein QIS74_00435 [Colletotrichum tabaci]|uniref:Uncharacterized protein n=1 Tax=Colletotrichum tabaci TaxID=1209068 RepID=A0AAV9TTV2_9PEZI
MVRLVTTLVQVGPGLGPGPGPGPLQTRQACVRGFLSQLRPRRISNTTLFFFCKILGAPPS